MAPSFFLDEDVNPEIAVRLRADGYDILTAQEAGRRGADDEDQLDYAASSQRILFTHNIKDYRVIAIRWAARQRVHSGILYTPQGHSAQICSSIRHLFELYSPDQLKNVTMGLPTLDPTL